MREKEYCIRADLNSEYILYIANCFGLYHVMVTNEKREKNYSVYGGYKNIGTAANRLKTSVTSYKSNKARIWYTSKTILNKIGAMNLPEP